MPNLISDQNLSRQISHLTQYLPNQDELKGKRQGSSFYRHTDEKLFVNEHKIVLKKINCLSSRFELTNIQKQKVNSVTDGLVHKVKKAFVNHNNPPANLDNFLYPKKRTG